MYGFKRNKSRPQASQNVSRQQTRFDGAQNSDTPPNKIGPYDVALMKNAVAMPDRIEGHYGRVLASDERIPGTGILHDLKQQSVSGRWLLHRGGKLWLTAGRRLREWSEVEVIGPDGSLTATGTFTDGVWTITGPASAYFSNMTLSGAAPGQEFTISVTDDGGGDFNFVLMDASMNAVCSGTQSYGATPGTVTLVAQGGSGISGSVDVAALISGNLPLTGSATGSAYTVEFSLRGLTEENTDGYTLWWKIEVSGGGTDTLITLYKDALMTEPVATATGTGSALITTVVPVGDTGISGVAELDNLSAADGTYDGSSVSFDFDQEDIDSPSSISSYGENGFVVFIRSSAPKSIYVEADLGLYWFLSDASGYGQEKIGSASPPDAYEYRFLYSFSRIVDPETMSPDYSANRVTGLIEFEGPSNKSLISETDYSAFYSSNQVSPTDPIFVTLRTSTNEPIGLNAAAYITHISLYRTVDLGVNNPGGQSEVYIWIADVPIYSTSYSDTTSDTVLLNRFSGGAQQGENFALRSRFFTPMAKGIGSIRPDFMATVAPRGTAITYCDVQVNPRFIGYHFASAQTFLTNDPVSEIVATKDLFVFLCPSSNYTSVTAISVDTGISGISYIPSIQNFEKSSQTVGIKYGQRVFQVDDNSFASLCSDGTVRVYQATYWGDALDDDRVHKLTELAQPGAVLGFIRGTLYMWYTESASATVTDKCLRYGFGGQAGNRWSPVERSTWAYPPVGGGAAGIYEQDDATLRLICVDDASECVFAIEDLPPIRQYQDDVVETAPVIEGAAEVALESLALPGYSGETLYGIIRSMGGGEWRIQLYESEEDRTADVNVVGQTMPISEPSENVEILGTIPGSVDVLSFSALEFTVVSGVAVASRADFSSPIRFREHEGARANFTCLHQESHLRMRYVYGMPVPTVAARWYADGAMVPQSESLSIPQGGDIQSWARVQGRGIQLEIEPMSSGWQLTYVDTQYQTQDRQSTNGPWDSADAQIQASIASDMLTWLIGQSGLVNRASPTGRSFSGGPVEFVAGPQVWWAGQNFLSPASFAFSPERGITAWTIMLWVRGPVLDSSIIALLTAAGAEASFIQFPDENTVDVGSFQYAVSPSVADSSGWQHFALTRDGEYFRVYQNGVEIGAGLLTPGSSVSLASVRVGSSSGACKMFDVRTYSKALSATAVKYYYDHPSQVPQ